jgi:hypothetical protein
MAGTYGKWKEILTTLGKAPKDLAEARRKVILMEANLFRNEILKGLREQAPGGKAFKPLTPETIALRKFFGFKGTKALLKHGDLRNAIAVVELGGLIFVGVPRTAKGSNGESLIDVARLNEEGSKPIVIKMTPKMAALLHMAFRKAGIEKKDSHRPTTGIIVVQIPARPFIGPVFEEFGKPKDVEKRMAEHMKKLMKGKGLWSAIGGST